MTAPAFIGVERLCPHCGYDLRAAPEMRETVRCPECGREWKRGVVSSRIPWVHRKSRGSVRAYVATAWMVLRHPVILGGEVRGRIGERQGRAFSRVSVWVGVVLGVMVACGWEGLLLWGGGPSRLASSSAVEGLLTYPILAAMDWRVVVVTAAVWVWLTLRVLGWMYRRMLAWAARGRGPRRRVGRLGYYGMVLGPLEVVLLGGALLTKVASGDAMPTPEVVQTWGSLAAAGLAAAAYAVLVWPTVGVMWGMGGPRRRGRMVMACAYPMECMLVGTALLVATAWVVGYAAIAVWVLLH